MLPLRGEPSAKEMPTQMELFSGWKEIAGYLGKGVRTVQRYERELRLPIHRPSGKTHGAVVATRAELDDWINTSPVRRELTSLRQTSERANQLGAKFLQIDSEIALTFASLALEASSNDKKHRTAETAHRAYDTIMRLRKNIHLTDEEKDKLDANLRRLKGELQGLGQSLS